MGCAALDVDNDGYRDFYFGTGFYNPGHQISNLMFRNNRGESFQDITYFSGTGHLQRCQGVSAADFDNDGDQDMYISMGGAHIGDKHSDVAFINSGNKNHWVTLKLEGRQSNRSAIGARIKLKVMEDSVAKEIHAFVGSESSFGSSSLQQELGTGRAGVIQSIEVLWPASNLRQTFTDVEADHAYRIIEGEAKIMKTDNVGVYSRNNQCPSKKPNK
jgi:hypothetical protein